MDGIAKIKRNRITNQNVLFVMAPSFLKKIKVNRKPTEMETDYTLNDA